MYGTVRTVVWADGRGDSPSDPILGRVRPVVLPRHCAVRRTQFDRRGMAARDDWRWSLPSSRGSAFSRLTRLQGAVDLGSPDAENKANRIDRDSCSLQSVPSCSEATVGGDLLVTPKTNRGYGAGQAQR